MKYLTYLFWGLLAVVSIFFIQAYFSNHPYYFNMLSTGSNWAITIFGLLVALIPVLYVFYSKEKTWKWIAGTFLIAFFLFAFIVGYAKGGFVSGGPFVLIVNYLILFAYWLVIILGFVALWDLVLKKIKFKKYFYDFAVKLWLGLSLVGILLYFVVAFQILHIWISYLILVGLAVLIYLQRKSLKEIFNGLLEETNEFIEELNQSEFSWVKYVFIWIFAVALWYVFVGLNYTFIPYPTAWDANHAYMFIPRVYGIYDGYPWNIDFRPDLYLWYGFLAWMYKLGDWTWFAPDTWMITFNFISGIFALYFGFMLVSTIVRYLDDKKLLSNNKYFVLATGFILVLARLTSWNGAFLLFVDNKTDIAVLMFVILALFLMFYSLDREKSEEKSNFLSLSSKLSLLFVSLAGFFFGIANLIKPTATFDFFESTLVLTILEIWFLAVVWMILFVAGLLAYLKFRGFQKAVSPAMSYSLMGAGSVLALIEVVWKFLKDKLKILYVLVFVGSFVLTLVFTKGVFGILQIVHWEKINPNLGKTLPALVMWNRLPVVKTSELTGELFKDLKKPIGSSYNEDNWRYVGYGSKDFWNPWWGFLVPEMFKDKYCVVLSNSQNTSDCKEILPKTSKTYENAVNNLVIEIYHNKDEKLFQEWITSVIENALKSGNLKSLATQLGVDTNLPQWKLKKEIYEKLTENTQKQLLLQLKQKLLSGDLNLQDYPKLFQTPENEELFKQLQQHPYAYESVSIPYKYLVPFNVTFNWSLQNLTSYYTDIGIIWLLLFFVVIYAFVYGLHLIWKGLVRKNQADVEMWKHIFAFAFATLVGWTIWYFVASGIIWYNIWGIIWLIITTLLFLSKWNDRYLLMAVLVFVAVFDIFLNLIRISSQWWGQIQNWYRSSVGLQYNYKIADGGIKPVQETKMPYTFDDVFHLQFNMYKKPIQAINARTPEQMAIIGWTYMRYFVNNQNKINADQFLMWLWRMGSDQNVENTYKRFKAYNLKDIVIDPNIASVVMGTWNISLWYRYFGKVDKNGNLTEKWVLPMFVDLASKGYLDYGFTNNLGIKYALIYSDEELSKILWINDLNKVRKIRYELTALKFLPRDIGFVYPDSNLWMKMYEEWIDAFYKIMVYRLQKALKNNDLYDFASDLADVNGLYVPDMQKILSEWISAETFDKMTIDEKTLVLQLMNILNQVAQNPASTQQVLRPIIQNALAGRAQLLFVKVK